MKAANEIYAIWLREMIRYYRARSRLISSVAMPFFWLAFAGVGLGSAFSLPGANYISFLAPGVVGMIVLFTSIFSGVSVIWDRQFGFLKEILAAPVSRTNIVLGETLGGATVAMINGMIMVAIGIAMGALSLGAGILPALVFMLLTAMCFVSVGLIIASRMKSMEGFQAIMSFLVMPMFFLSGALFPLDKTPAWMQAISYIDPLRYGVDGLRDSLLGVGMLPMWTNFAVLAGIAAFLTAIGSYAFSKSSV